MELDDIKRHHELNIMLFNLKEDSNVAGKDNKREDSKGFC